MRAHQLLHCLLHILVPEAVYQWVQHGNDDCVEHRGHLDQQPGTFVGGNTIEKEDGAVKNADGSAVGGTGGKDFVASSSSRHFHDSNDNENVRSENDHQTAKLIESGKNKNDPLTNGGVRAGHRNNGSMLTHKVVYELGPAEKQS